MLMMLFFRMKKADFSVKPMYFHKQCMVLR